MRSCALRSFSSLCMASAVYFVPFPCGCIMMIAVKAGTSKVGSDGPVAGLERHGPCQLAVRHDLEEAADVGYLLTFRRAHHRAEDAAGAKVDFAIDRFPRRWREP